MSEAAPRPRLRIIYEGQNISDDITASLVGFAYTDFIDGFSDNIEIELADPDSKWRNEWYPERGDKITAEFGFDTLAPAGDFEVDDIDVRNNPDVVVIKAIAAVISTDLRTKRSSAHEEKSLREIAEDIAGRHGMSVTGDIENLVLSRVTQNRESDLDFMKRLAKEYGYRFSVRGDSFTFIKSKELEAAAPVMTINAGDFVASSIEQKTTGTAEAAEAKYVNPTIKKIIEHREARQGQGASPDVIQIRQRVDNQQQAEVLSDAALNEANTNEVSGRFTVYGNVELLSGNNVRIDGRKIGRLAGVFHITETSHRIFKSSGYTTVCYVKRVAQ